MKIRDIISVLVIIQLAQLVQAADYSDMVKKGPLCIGRSSLFSTSTSGTVETDAMERVMLDYEGSMRPGAFQCCLGDSQTVTGFRMHLHDYLVGDNQATTGCIGDCETGCGPVIDFDYSGWYLDFVFSLENAGGNRNLIRGITVRDHPQNGGNQSKT